MIAINEDNTINKNYRDGNNEVSIVDKVNTRSFKLKTIKFKNII